MGVADQELWKARLLQLGMRGRLPGQLTQTVVNAARARPLGERYTLPDGEIPGLLLEVRDTGATTFTLLYRNAAKKKTRYTIGSAAKLSLDEARQRALEELAKIGRGIDPAAERRAAAVEAVAAEHSTVRAFLTEEYGPKVLAHQKTGGAPKEEGEEPSGTWARILASWEPLLDLPLASVTREAIEGVLAARKAPRVVDGKTVPGKAAGTLLRDWSGFRALLAAAVDRGALAAMPMAKRPEPIRKTRGNQRVRWLGQFDAEDVKPDGAERARFLAQLAEAKDVQGCSGDFLRFACRLALATGMRRGEIVRLTQSMVNERARKLTLPAEITKSNKARVVSLSDPALAALKAWKVRGTKGELCPGEAEMWEDRITQQGFPKLCENAGITDLHFHDLRHDFAVRLLRSGATLEQVRDALGHASITQTEKYAHVLPGDVHAAVLKLGAAG